MVTHRGLIIHLEEFEEHLLYTFAQAGLNVLGFHPVGGHKAHESLEAAVVRHAMPTWQQHIAAAKALGIEIAYEAHALRWLLPASLFPLAPDWFRMDASGQRVPDFHMCVSNPDAIRYLETRAEHLARMLDTGSHQYCLWADDVSSTRCQCPQCANLSASDQVLLIANAIQRGVRRFDPQGRVPYLAYQDTLEVPTQVEPEAGIFLEFAPIWRDHHRPLNDPDCAKNVRETRHIRQLLSFFGTSGAQALDYWMDNSLFSNWQKPPQPFTLDEEVMRQDVAFYKALGFERITSFGCYLGRDYVELHGKPPFEALGRCLEINGAR